MTFSDDVQKAMIAGAFGLVGTIVPAVISWSHDRSAISARTRTLDDATKRLDFWEQWLKLCIQVAPNDPTINQVRFELTRLSEIIQRDTVTAHAQQKLRARSLEFQTKLEDLSAFRRVLLLYEPARSTAWVPRIFFFIGLACAIITPLGLAAPTDPLTVKDLFISELFLLAWMTIFRSLSRWLEQPRHVPAAVEIHTTDIDLNMAPPPPPPPKPA